MRRPSGSAARTSRPDSTSLQNLGWAIFELIIIATAAAALSDRVFGFEGKWLWTLVFGAARRPRWRCSGRSRSCAASSAASRIWVVLASAPLPHRGGRSTTPTSAPTGSPPGEGELVLRTHRPDDRAARLLAAADRRLHALLARRPVAFVGSAVGYLVPNAWLYALGALLVLTHAAISDPDRRLMTSIAAGGARRGARAARAHRRRDRRGVRERLLDGGVAPERAAARAAAAADRRRCGRARRSARSLITWAQYETFLFLLGSFFVPLFGVLLADWLLARLPLHARRRLRGAGVPAADDRRLARRLLPLPVAAPARGRARLDRLRWRTRDPRGHRRVAAELRARVRARVARRAAGPAPVIARVATVDGVLEVDLETEEVEPGAGAVEPQQRRDRPARVVCARRGRLDRRRRRRCAPAAGRLARCRADVARGRTRPAARLRGRRAARTIPT